MKGKVVGTLARGSVALLVFALISIFFIRVVIVAARSILFSILLLLLLLLLFIHL